MKGNQMCRSLVLLVAFSCAIVAGATAVGAADGSRTRPNVIVILADDLGYGDLGCHGCKDIRTPHIDSLAASGIRCTSGYAAHSFCSPTRASLMTGRYQHRFGHENNPKWDPADDKLGLPLSQITIADVMKEAGYVTGAVGKWHLGAAPRFHPNRRGFAEYFGFIGGGHMYLPDRKGAAEYLVPLMRNQESVDEREYLTDAFSREAIGFIERNKDRPFFLYLAYNAVHGPLQAPPKYLDRFKEIGDQNRRTYAAMLSAMDDGVGQVLATLGELRLEGNTLVFFLSDNGGPIAPNSSTNTPLRGAKGQLFEGGIRVPFLVQWKGVLKPGVCDEPVSTIDFLPTIAAVCGARVPASARLDGVDFMPHLSGRTKTPPHERLFWRVSGGASWAVREGNWKLVHGGQSDQLFDLSQDISEQTNLAAQQQDVVASLTRAYEEWNRDNIEPLWENPQTGRQRRP